MQCLSCQRPSMKKQNGLFFCQEPDCGHFQLHPLSYAPEQMKGKEDDQGRGASQVYCPALTPCSQQDSVLRKLKRIISDACHVLKLSEYVGKLALTIAIQTAIQEFGQQYTILLMNDDLQGKENGRHKKQSTVTKKKLSAFALNVACYQREFYLEEYRIAKYFRLSFKQWKDTLVHFMSQMKASIHNLPPVRSSCFLIKKVCKARGITNEEQEAMLEMCARMEIGKEFRAATIACIAFWKVCQYSKLYCQLKVEELCRGHESMYDDSSYEGSKIQAYFDIAAQTVKKVFKDYFKNNLNKYLPECRQRLQEIE